MIKAESKGGERTLRSASPHRNAYKSDFHAIKCSFDGPKSEAAAKSYTNGSSDTREDSRGRPFGTRVNKIKNIFLQMDGQQQECQEAKVTLKSDMSPMSPTKLQFPVNTHRANLNTATTPESQNVDKTPKGEDVEIDKVALAEKFSVTRKLFERGIKEQPAAEKQSPNRVVNHSSHGSSSDEGKSTRRVSGSFETTLKSEQTSTVKCQPDRNADGEKKHPSRVSLNAGPMSKRLENYMGENDSEDTSTAAKGGMVPAKQHSMTEQLPPTSPTKDSVHKPTTPAKEVTNSSPAADGPTKNSPPTAFVINKPPASGSNIGLKPSFPVTNAAYKSVSPTSDATNKPLSPEKTTPISPGYKRSRSSGDGFNRVSVGGDEGKPHSPPPRDVNQPLPSAGGFQNTNRAKYSDKAKSNDSVVHSPNREKPPSQNSTLDRGVGMVRAELVVVQNESSESEENEDEKVEDNVFEEQNVQPTNKDLPTDLQKNVPAQKQNCSSTHQVIVRDVAKETQKLAGTVGEGGVQEDNKQFDSLVVSQDCDVNHEEDDEAAEEESELEEQMGEYTLDRASPVVCGIENAAFVDDRDVDQVLREEEEEEEEDQMYREYDNCYEAPGLSDEEEPPPKRKIKFSSDPILVSILCSPETPKSIVITNQCIMDSAVMSDRGISLQTHSILVEVDNSCL